MNLRELMTSTPYTTVHAPHRGHVAYSTRKRFGTEVERVAHINLCDHPSLTRLRALAHLATIPLPIYNREGARTVKKDDYAIHYDDGHVLAVTITRPHSSNGTRNAEATRGLAYDALILDVTTQELHQQHSGSYTWANMPPTARLHYKDLSPHAAVTSYLETLNAARIPAALHHPTDGWSTNRSWMCSLYPHVLDELVHVTAQRRAALTTTTKGTNQ
jgi:hypothetical protein